MTGIRHIREFTRAAGWGFSGVVLATCALEVVLRLLPVSTSSSTGYYFDPMILTYPAHVSFTTATGWRLSNPHTHRTNNFGFVADHEFTPNRNAVSLIGDSYVEASMLAPEDRLAARLEQRGLGRTVFALGAPGTSLLDYAERVRFAANRFDSRDFVIFLERGDVGQSLCGSGNISAPCLDPVSLAPRVERQAPPDALKRLLRHFALPQYLFSQLKLDPLRWLASTIARIRHDQPGPHRVDALKVSAEAANRVVRTFFDRIRPYRGGRFVLVLGPGWTDPARLALLEAASAEDVTVLDSTPILATHEHATGISMRVAPDDGHLNGLATGLIADRLVPLLRTTGDGPG